MQAWMQQFLSTDPPSPDVIEAALLDYGFYHRLLDVKRMYSEYKNSKRYGYAGGVLDQPDEYWDDIATMHWLELWVKHVGPLPRLEQTSIFETLRNENRIDGRWLNG